MKTYEAGFVTISSDSNEVQGIGTRWLNYVTSGCFFRLNGESLEILSVNDNDSITLGVKYQGQPVIKGRYEIEVVETDQVRLSRRNRAIDVARSRLLVQPVNYDGKSLDADRQSVSNIRGKIVEIESRAALGSTAGVNMIWRDSSNITHTWADVDQYLNWLRGLIVMISDRNTSIYTQSWLDKGAPI